MNLSDWIADIPEPDSVVAQTGWSFRWCDTLVLVLTDAVEYLEMLNKSLLDGQRAWARLSSDSGHSFM